MNRDEEEDGDLREEPETERKMQSGKGARALIPVAATGSEELPEGSTIPAQLLGSSCGQPGESRAKR